MQYMLLVYSKRQVLAEDDRQEGTRNVFNSPTSSAQSD